MRRGPSWIVPCLVIALAGCGANDRGGSAKPQDFTTPEGAILSLEDAYRAQDVEAAVRCKDFQVEATLMLKKLDQDFSGDPEILAKTAEVLELGFRAELKRGFPDFRDVVSTFPEKQPYEGRDDILLVTEQCRRGDGTPTMNNLVVAKTSDGWKVISVPD